MPHHPRPDARSEPARPSLLEHGAADGDEPSRFLDALDPARAPGSGRSASPRSAKPPVRSPLGLLLAGAGVLLGMGGWLLMALDPQTPPPAQRLGTAPPAHSPQDAGAALPVRGPARIERVEPRPVPSPSKPAAATAPPAPRLPAAAALPPGDAHPGTAQTSAPRLQRTAAVQAPTTAAWKAPAEADAVAQPAGPPQTAARQAAADVETDAEAELLDAVRAWDASHPPAADHAAAPAFKPDTPASASR